jgi:hypothetical protein
MLVIAAAVGAAQGVVVAGLQQAVPAGHLAQFLALAWDYATTACCLAYGIHRYQAGAKPGIFSPSPSSG